MFRILVVEDDTDKLRDIYSLLEKIENLSKETIESVIDANSAKKLMKTNQYDLLILDISIPKSKSAEIDAFGGIVLLEEVMTRSGYNLPTHIIGLTSHDEILGKTREKFQQNIFTIIKYELSSADWAAQLMAGVRYRVTAKENITPDSSYDYDIAILCALKSELEPHLNNGLNWTILPASNDDTIYYVSEYADNNSLRLRIVATSSPRMGMPTCACLATKMIIKFRPRHFFMTGIMAGIKDRVNIGDIVIASPVWDWGSGKWIPNTKLRNENESSKDVQSNWESIFQIDPLQYIMDTRIFRGISLLIEDKNYTYKLRNRFHTHPSHDMNVHIGPVASGAAVLSDTAILNRVKAQHRKLLGVEMEAYAIFSAADNAPWPKPIPICIKSIVDFGDTDKQDDFQKFGSFVTAQMLYDLLPVLYSEIKLQIKNHKD